MLAFVRLANDAALRASLGRAARAWWAQHATVAHAVEAWRRLLEEAVTLPVPPRPPGWPSHLDGDATGTMRGVLEEFGIDGAALGDAGLDDQRKFSTSIRS